MAVARLDEDEKTTISLADSGGRPYKMLLINEPGLYSLILRSDKPEAKEFKRWITHNVIPSIRKTGQYAAPKLTGAQAVLALEVTQRGSLRDYLIRILQYDPRDRERNQA